MAKSKVKAKTKKPAVKATAKSKKSVAKKAVAKKASPKKSVAPARKPVAKTVAKKTATKTLPKISTKALQSLGLNPLADRLVVKVATGEKKTAGGLYIPDTAQVSGNFQGQVLATGRGNTNKKGQLRPMDVKTGDEILFSEYAGTKMNIDGHDVLILRETDVLGVVEK